MRIASAVAVYIELGRRQQGLATAAQKGLRYPEKMTKNTNYTYLVRCRDGSLYCGWTNHLAERIQAHNEGKGARYTKSRRPVELVYYEELPTKQEAMRREYAIKRLTRTQKLNLIFRSSNS